MREKSSLARPKQGVVRFGPSRSDTHDVVYFRRHKDDDSAETEPGREVLNQWPPSVRAKARAVLAAVAAAPPNRFSGGGYWESMKGQMAGWFEVRVDGPKRHHYRLFCLLDYQAEGLEKPLLVVIDGRDKPYRSTLEDREYFKISALGEEYLSRNPRSIS